MSSKPKTKEVDELNKDELLEFLDRFYLLWREWMQKKTTMPNMLKLAGEAHQQIREMIQKYFKYTEEVEKSVTALKEMRKRIQNQPEMVVTYHSGEKTGYKVQPEITMKEIRGWAEEARERVTAHENWGYVEDVIKEAFQEKGFKIIKK